MANKEQGNPGGCAASVTAPRAGLGCGRARVQHQQVVVIAQARVRARHSCTGARTCIDTHAQAKQHACRARTCTLGSATKKGRTFGGKYPVAARYLSTSQRSANSFSRLSNLLATNTWAGMRRGGGITSFARKAVTASQPQGHSLPA